MLGKTILLGISAVSAVNAFQYGYNHVPVRKDIPLVAANFKDVDIGLYAPAFLDPESIQAGFKNGTQGPTSHEDIANFTSEELRSFPFIKLSSSKGPKTSDKVRVWVQGAVHGNEPAGDQSLLALLGKFDKDPKWASKILKNLDIVILPRYNPDGVYYFQRVLATNFDPNRDHTKLARQQTRDIKQLFNEFAPHVAIDMHEYGSSSRYGNYVQASDGLFSAAKNLNINKNIRELSEKLFAKNIGDAMVKAGLRWEPYVTGRTSTDPDYVPKFDEAGSDAKIGRNAMGLTQSITFLIEMRGIGLADQEFQRRTAAGLTMASSIIETASNNAQKVFKTVEGGIKDFIKSREPIVITDSTKYSTRMFQMIDYTNGSVVKVPVQFASTTPTTANLTRSRPESYLIPVAWADIAKRLEVSGLEVETLSKPWSGTVEALSVTSSELSSSYYEGAVLATITTETKKRQLTLPAGSFLVSTRQKNAGLALNALEPENIDSYASFNIIPLEVGDEYPIFRISVGYWFRGVLSRHSVSFADPYLALTTLHQAKILLYQIQKADGDDAAVQQLNKLQPSFSRAGVSTLHAKINSPPPRIVKSQGCWLETEQGHRILDASSGAAVVSIGHNESRVKDAIAAQLDQVAYCYNPFFTTEAAEKISSFLTESTNGAMSKVFIVSSGTEAVEAALKIARQYFTELPTPQPSRTKFIARKQSYHGNTLGSLAVGGHKARRGVYEPILATNVSHVSPCYPYREMKAGETEQQYVQRLAQELDDEFQRVGPDTVCAFIAETVSGTSLGCAPPVPGYFKAIKEVCDRYGALLIMDEVMSGMGRTGTLHAWEQEGVVPDLQTVAKGLGAGYMPVGALLVGNKVADALANGSGAFSHSQTYQGHPVACAAAYAVQTVMKEDNMLQNVQDMGKVLGEKLKERLAGHKNVGDVRGRGLYWGLEFVRNKETKEPFDLSEQIAGKLHKTGLEADHGISLIPATGNLDGVRGDMVIVSPPFTITKEEIEMLVDKVDKVVASVLGA
ncbi:pyridoxal phosphate-dependent transferase [Fusarium redolens]|uniref:Pyridoxal phosphate-dependent transferase n=1 Tax=Fusarium redolens TaxID=48865 RepID=A0A9P9H9L2_FUSRE|nr:pyridoxal phosphate-dependent transferase [Fusarium redolens]KAH7253555.1 pyridoxal phosphate-dependent transferase [Fusarium redolens]